MRYTETMHQQAPTTCRPLLHGVQWFAPLLAAAMILALHGPAVADQASPQRGHPPVDYQEQIEHAEQVLEADPQDADARLTLGKAYYYISAFEEGKASKRANRQALKHLGWLLERDPQGPIPLVFHGASELIKAKHAWAPWSKGSIAKSGLKKMLKAAKVVEDDAAEVEVLAVRGVATSHLPDVFEYGDESRADLEAVAPRLHEAWVKGWITANLATVAYHHQGMFLKQDGHTNAAREAFKNAVAITTDTPAGQSARAELDELD